MSHHELKEDSAGGASLLNLEGYLEMTRLYYGRVYYTALSMVRDRDMAEDITQETFLRAWLKRDAFRDSATQLQPWLSRISQNLANQWLRQGQRRSQLMPIISMEDVTVDPKDTARKNPHEEAVDAERSSQLTSAVMNLPDDLRQAILLHYGEGLTPADIARLNGEARSTVTRRLNKAHKLLKEYMDQGLAEGLASLKPGKLGMARTLTALGALSLLPSVSQARLLEMSANTPPPPAIETLHLTAGASKSISSSGGFLVKINSFKTAIIGSLFVVGLGSYLVSSNFKEFHYWQNRVSTTIGRIRGTEFRSLTTSHGNLNSDPKRNAAPRRTRGLASNKETPAIAKPKEPSAYGPLPDTNRLVEVRGKVIDASGNPVVGAKVKGVSREGIAYTILQKAPETVTNSDGTFHLKQIPPGSLGLQVQSPHHALVVESIEAPADDLSITVNAVGAEFSGIVIHGETGQPVSDTTVSLEISQSAFPMDPPLMITGPDGKFHFVHVPAGEYFLDVKARNLGMIPEKPGWFSESPVKTYKLTDGKTVDNVKVRMRKGQTVSGIVRDSSTGQPLPGVTVDERNFDFISVQQPVVTDASGRYRIENVVGSSGFLVWFALQKPGYVHMPKTQRGEENSPMFELGNEIEMTRDFVMVPAVSVSGVLRDESGQPVADALLVTNADCMASQPPFVRTDAMGRYEIGLPANCNALLTFTRKDFPLVRQNISISNDPFVQDIIMYSARSVGGVVLDANGQPLPGAAVEAYISANQYGNTISGGAIAMGKTVTDKNGRFAIGNLPKEPMTLVATKQHFAEGSAPVELKDSIIEDSAVITLSGGKDVYGILTTFDGKPVSDAQVELFSNEIDSKPIQTRSQTDGTFWFHSLPARPMRIRAEHLQHGKIVAKKMVEPGGEDVELIFGGPDSSRTLEVNVVDSITSQPVHDYEILQYVGMKPFIHPENRKFYQADVTADQTVKYTIKAPGYTLLQTGYLQVPDHQPSPIITLSMGQGGSVTGQVKSPEGTTVSVSGLFVKVERLGDGLPDYETQTDELGRFKLAGVPVGEREIFIHGPMPFGVIKKQFDIAEGTNTDLGDLILQSGATIQGSITRSDGTPIPGVEIEVGELNKKAEKTQSDSLGRYKFLGLGKLDYWLKIPRYNISTSARMESESESQTHNYVIGSNSIKGRVVQNGLPVSNASVNAHDGNSSRQAKTDSLGRFLLEGLPAGRYGLTARSNTRSGRQGISLTDGQTTEVTIQLDSGTMIGRLLDANAKPVSGANIHIANRIRHPGLTSGYGATTKEDGGFEWQNLPAGTYSVSASIDGQLITSVQTVVLPPNGVTSGLELRVPKQTGGIDITMKRSDGKPALDAQVRVSVPYEANHNFKEKVDISGLLALRGIPPGKYQVSITPAGRKEPLIHDVEIHGTTISKIEQELP